MMAEESGKVEVGSGKKDDPKFVGVEDGVGSRWCVVG